MSENGLLLKAKQVIDKSQTYFWTAEWQQGEQEAQAEIDAGRLPAFESVAALITELDSED